MIKIFYLLLFLSNIVFNKALYGAELMSMDFYQTGETSRIEMLFDVEGVQAKKFQVAEDKQIIIDLFDVDAKDKVIRSFDTSEFSGSSVFVRAYKKNKNIRIAIQLRDNIRTVFKREMRKLILVMENRFGVFSQQEVEKNQTYDEKVNEENIGKLHIPKSDSLTDILDNIILSGRKKYVGKKISFNVKNVSVADILKMIADSSGFNIILTKEVEALPPLTLNLTNIPWDQALDTILNLNKLVANKNGVILMITTMAKATERKKAEIQASKLAKKHEPLVTKLFPVSYSKLTDLKKILDDYLTPERGKISLDERTNILIVKDTATVIERIKKIVDALDTQTPQILIESRIVEVFEGFEKEIGLSKDGGLSFGFDPIGSNNAENSGPGFSFSSAPVPNGKITGLSIARFSRLLNLDFTLQLMESESKGKIISSPKVIAQNNKKAEIKTTDTQSYSVQSTGNTTNITYEEAKASLSLKVTPQVTNEGSIILDVQLEKEQFGQRPAALAPPNKQGREVKTSVLVENGSTVVIGGVYSYNIKENHSGIPFLKDLPLLGWLFRTQYNPESSKNEMVIFLTPRIINQEEAGLVQSDIKS